MIYMKTMLDVADNTGAKKASCIGVIARKNRAFASIGDIVTVTVRDAAPNAAIKKGEKAQAVVVRMKNPFRRPDGSYLQFDSNAIVFIDAQTNPRGTRVFGPVARELREKNFMKIISLAPEVI